MFWVTDVDARTRWALVAMIRVNVLINLALIWGAEKAWSLTLRRIALMGNLVNVLMTSASGAVGVFLVMYRAHLYAYRTVIGKLDIRA